MIGFILLFIIVVILALIFGSANTKRDILNEIGLDLSSSKYESLKEKEFRRNCLKAINNAISMYNITGNNELAFLNNLLNVLDEASLSYRISNGYNLFVKTEFIEFSSRVVYRRIHTINDNKENSKNLEEFDFTDKQDVKRYINRLWDKYQYPWPQDWIKY